MNVSFTNLVKYFSNFGEPVPLNGMQMAVITAAPLPSEAKLA